MSGDRALFLMGTAANSGKSLLGRALCRLAVRTGVEVVPYKAVSVVERAVEDPNAGRVDLALWLLAHASRAEHSGRPLCSWTVQRDADGSGLLRRAALHRTFTDHSLPVEFVSPDGVFLGEAAAPLAEGVRQSICDDLLQLRQAADDGSFVLVEGAGAPVDLGEQDMGNVIPARALGGAVVLIASGRHGGAGAALLGTIELLPDDLRGRLAGFIVNQVPDSDPVTTLSRRVERATGVPCLGHLPSVPFYRDLPAFGADAPVFDSWDAEIDALADFVEKSLGPDVLREAFGIGASR